MQVGAPVEEGHECSAACEPDRGLPGGVAATDHGDAGGAAEPGLGRAGCVEHGHPFELREAVDGQAPVLRAGGEKDGASLDAVAALEADDVTGASGLQRDRAVRGRRARVELPRLDDGPPGELGARDPAGEAEVVLDSPRRAGLAAECRALDDERLEALGRAEDRGAETGGPGADDEQVDLLEGGQLAADPERARHLPERGPPQLTAARQPDQRQLAAPRRGEASIQWKGMWFPRANSSICIVASDECGPMISMPTPSSCCSDSAPLHQRGEDELAERAVLEQKLRSASRSTRTYRSGCVTTAVTKTVCPERRFSSPRKLPLRWRMISPPVSSRMT